MEKKNENSFNNYEKILIFTFGIANSLFLLRVISLIFPYIDFQLKSKKLYILIKDIFPCTEKNHIKIKR